MLFFHNRLPSIQGDSCKYFTKTRQKQINYSYNTSGSFKESKYVKSLFFVLFRIFLVTMLPSHNIIMNHLDKCIFQ